MLIKAKDRDWVKTADGKYLPGVFRIPEGVVVRFEDGSMFDSVEDETTMEGSPVHQALVEAGLELDRVDDSDKIVFVFEDIEYVAPLSFYKTNQFKLPDGRVIQAVEWLERHPPIPIGLKTVIGDKRD